MPVILLYSGYNMKSLKPEYFVSLSFHSEIKILKKWNFSSASYIFPTKPSKASYILKPGLSGIPFSQSSISYIRTFPLQRHT